MKPLRTCIACRQKQEKENLLRIVSNKSNLVLIDKEQNADGRGCYICKNKDCLMKAVQKRLLSKSYKKNIDNKIYEELQFEIDRLPKQN